MDKSSNFESYVEKIKAKLHALRVENLEKGGNAGKGAVVSSKDTEQDIAKVIRINMKKPGNILKFVCNAYEKEDGTIVTNGFTQPLSVPYNLFHEVMRKIEKKKVKLQNDEHSHTRYEQLTNFFPDLIAVQVNQGAAKIMAENTFYLLNNNLYWVQNKEVRSFNDNAPIVTLDTLLNEGCKFNYIPEMGTGGLSNNESDGVLNVTAGEKKNHTILLYNANSQEVREYWQACRYVISAGVSMLLQRNTWTNQKELCQSSNRISQKMAPNLSFGRIGAMALYAGKFKGANASEAMDGFALIDDEAITKWLNMLSPKYKFCSEFVRGKLFQCRPYSFKTLGVSVSSNFMKEVLTNIPYSDVQIIYRDNLNNDDQSNFNQLWFEKSSAAWKNKLIVITDNEEAAEKLQFDENGRIIGGIELISDLNGAKAPWDLEMEDGWNVLNVSHATKDVSTGASISSQLLQTLALYDWEGTKELVSQMAERKADKLERQLLEDRLCERYSLELAEETSIADVICKMTPLINKEYSAFYRSAVDQAIKSFIHDARSLNFKTDGFYTKAEPDLGTWFNQKFLGMTDEGFVEVYSPLAARLKLDYGMAVKYPKAGSEEFIICKFLSKGEYFKKIMTSDCSKETKAAVWEMVVATSEGALILPDIPVLNKLLAGMDFDGDSLIVFVNPQLVSMMMKIRFVAVDINEDDNGMLTNDEVGEIREWFEDFIARTKA